MSIARLSAAALLVIAALCTSVASAATPLPNRDTRARDAGPVGVDSRRARGALEQRLGNEGVVTTDPITGAVRLVARTDGFLTPRRKGSAAAIALRYVREHQDAFGLAGSDLDRLRLTSAYRSLDGVTHLAYTQTDRGIAAYDNVLLANVARDGRLLNVGGAAAGGLRAASVTPDLTASRALAVVRAQVGGRFLAPRATQARGPERATRFSNGDSARLTLFDDGRATRLAWRLEVTGAHDVVYEVVVDAASGRVLKRRSLTESATAQVYRNHPGAVNGGTAGVVTLDPAWLNPSTPPKLSGNNAHAYADADALDATAAAPNVVGPTPGDVEIAPSSPAPDWNHPITPFDPPGQACPPPTPLPSPCTWDSASPGTRETNRNQATTQLFYFVNTFHDHLAAPPIDFTHAARNFELDDADGAGIGALGGDPVMAETDNYLNPDENGPTSVNNASMTTRLDGTPPRLEMFLFKPVAPSPGDPNPPLSSLNSADTADIVYHEYVHGLTNRSVGSGVGMDADQSRALGEGWSDWYALDYLEHEGLRPDAIGTRGEMTIGDYLIPGGFRTQGADCPVGSAAAACPGKPGAHTGGYTLGDMGAVSPSGFEVHADGEIWLETLWDLRADLRAELGPELGTQAARRLVTSGLRLSPNNPSFLEARDAILLADRTLGGDHHDLIWTTFAERGMGYNAAVTSSAATTAVANFDLPPRLVHESTTLSDAPPPAGNDGDDVPEPGETIRLTEELRNPHLTDNDGIGGVLSAGTAGVTVTQPAAAWPAIAARTAAASTAPFEVALAPSASCDTTAQLSLAMTTTSPNSSFTIPLKVPIGSKSSADVPERIPGAGGGAVSTLTFGGSGAVNDLEVRIARLAHTWVGDLVITLTNPAQTKTVTLVDRPGRPPAAASDDFGVSGDDLVDLVLDDDATAAIEDLPATSPAGGYTGRVRPNEALSQFDGDERQGTWTLTVVDAFAADDSGTLSGWGIRPAGGDCPNRAPEVVDDAYAVDGGQVLTGTSVLGNDGDPDGDLPLQAAPTSTPAHGTLALAPGGTFTYTPDPGFRGDDAFSYRASDSQGLDSAQPAVVRISVGNRAPSAADDGYSATAGVALSGTSVLANDTDANGDALSAALASPPAHGTVALAPDGTFTYTPDAGFSGRDAFAYRASDGSLSSAPATAAITVVAGPVAPPPPPVPAPPPARAPAKLEVLRAGVGAGRLDVLATITSRATSSVRVSYRSAGRTTTFDAAIRNGRISFRKLLPRAQRTKPTGIFTLSYGGSATVQADSVRLRAARGKARLVRMSSRIDGGRRLRVAGTIAPRARGVVRVRLDYVASGDTRSLRYTARIRGGRWSLAAALPADAAGAGGQLSIVYTGYEPLLIRGEQLSQSVTPAG